MPSETVTHPRGTSPVRGLAASLVFVVMLLAALALWTAIPLGWIWIGSKVATSQFPAEGPYAVVAVGIVVTILLDAWLIGRLNALYVRITGTNRLTPMRPSWLKSMRDTGSTANSTTVVEAVMMGSVLLAGVVFVAWFFLLAGSPLPNQ
jgi:small-conductance mechanosensitive channel